MTVSVRLRNKNCVMLQKTMSLILTITVSAYARNKEDARLNLTKFSIKYNEEVDKQNVTNEDGDIFSLLNAPEDARLNFTGLALKYVGEVEEHQVTTEDGYILTLFHIPGDKTKPLFIMHGVMGSSDEFIVRGNNSFVVTFNNAGYDLWLGNYRGNRYSRRHSTLDPDKNPSFWEFGPHQHGCSDLATSIDFVLNKTGESQLSLMGHSEGTMITYILGSERQEYNNKIKIFIALAPVCHVQYVAIRLPSIIQFGYSLRSLVRRYKIEELGEYQGARAAMIRKLCGQTRLGIKTCRKLIFTFSGFDENSLEPEFMPTLFWHYPAGTSRMNLEHLLQMLVYKRFANYDYGPTKNLKRYGSKIPPKYDLKKVTMRTFLFAAKNDKLSVLEDTRRQAKELPNVVDYTVMDDEVFNHIDFTWSRRSIEIQPKVLKILQKYN